MIEMLDRITVAHRGWDLWVHQYSFLNRKWMTTRLNNRYPVVAQSFDDAVRIFVTELDGDEFAPIHQDNDGTWYYGSYPIATSAEEACQAAQGNLTQAA